MELKDISNGTIIYYVKPNPWNGIESDYTIFHNYLKNFYWIHEMELKDDSDKMLEYVLKLIDIMESMKWNWKPKRSLLYFIYCIPNPWNGIESGPACI